VSEPLDLHDVAVAVDAATEGLAPAQVGELLGLLAKGVRAHQMYRANNPVYQRFVEGLRQAFVACWAYTGAIRLNVEENAFRFGDQRFVIGEGRDNIAFLFYKDGVRHVTFLPGFEDELEGFLEVIHRAKQLGPEEDDLVTLLWEREFDSFEYGYIDMLAEGLDIPDGGDVELQPIPAGIVANELASGDYAPGRDLVTAPTGMVTTPAGTISRENFQEALYFLDPVELEALRAELEREWSRDVKADVLNALFDRLEDGSPERQDEILSILHQLLPVYVGRGDLPSAATILRELDAILKRGGVFDAGRADRVARLFEELSSPAVLGQLVQVLEDGGMQRNAEELGFFLSHLRPIALPALVRASELAGSEVVRSRLQSAIDRLGERYPEQVLGLLESEDEAVVTGAVRLAGRLRLVQAAPAVAKLLDRPDPAMRLAVVEALVAIRSGAAVGVLQNVLDDPVREIRIAAARGLGALRYQPAKARFEALIEGRLVRSADITEKLAFFEAYAALAAANAVPLLDRLLNGKGLLGRRQPSEIRACAATALGKIPVPAARTALEHARNDADPVVRSAVQRALRRGEAEA
jgi:hypothetical protein